MSAGSTGAVLTGALLRVGRIRGISRPAVCPALPTAKGGKVFIIDAGANAECKPVNLCSPSWARRTPRRWASKTRAWGW